MSIHIPESIADRRPAYVQLSYVQGGTPPHVSTTRATYTIPTNRLGLLTYTNCAIRRVSNSTILNRASLVTNYTPMSGAIATIMRLEVLLAATPSIANKDMLLNMPLFAGDTIDITTIDVSVGGAHDIVMYTGILLYDL